MRGKMKGKACDAGAMAAWNRDDEYAYVPGSGRSVMGFPAGPPRGGRVRATSLFGELGFGPAAREGRAKRWRSVAGPLKTLLGKPAESGPGGPASVPDFRSPRPVVGSRRETRRPVSVKPVTDSSILIP